MNSPERLRHLPHSFSIMLTHWPLLHDRERPWASEPETLTQRKDAQGRPSSCILPLQYTVHREFPEGTVRDRDAPTYELDVGASRVARAGRKHRNNGTETKSKGVALNKRYSAFGSKRSVSYRSGCRVVLDRKRMESSEAREPPTNQLG